MQLNMGKAFLQIGDEESSMLYLEQAESLGALQTQSRTPLINAYYKAGLNYLEQENLNEASKLFKRVLSLDRARVEIYRLLGDLAAKKGLREEAIGHFKKYLELYPKDQAANEYLYSLYFNYANQLMEKGEFKAAQISFKAAQAIVPESPLILYSLGSLAYNNGDTKRAIQHLAVAYTTAPDELRESTRAMLYNSALSSLNAHHLDLAVAAISPLSEGSDAQIKDLSLAGAIYLERHEFKIARDIFLRILNRDPTHPQAIINISIAEENAVEELFQEGLAAYKKGQYKEAIA
jgi:tetratricopeptide (TPR) repeat protein